MRLTKKKAIEITIELWTWLALTGHTYKGAWNGWDKYGAMLYDCPLCEWARNGNDEKGCGTCPYYEEFGRCVPVFFGRRRDTPFSHWQEASTPEDRKKDALLFLEHLRRLK